MADLPAPFPGRLTAERFPLRTPDDVAPRLQLHFLGSGVKRTTRNVGCTRNTVRKYATQGACRPPLRGHQIPAISVHLKSGHHGWRAEA
jgi:hypothetical protein